MDVEPGQQESTRCTVIPSTEQPGSAKSKKEHNLIVLCYDVKKRHYLIFLYFIIVTFERQPSLLAIRTSVVPPSGVPFLRAMHISQDRSPEALSMLCVYS